MAEYKDCYFAFMDILGFKNLVRSASCDEILSIYNEAKKQYEITMTTEDKLEPLFDISDMHIKIMSDTICIYIYSDIPRSLPSLIYICTYFQARMLWHNPPVLIRGGISQGMLYANEEILFGEALVNAYLLESNNAIVPRIILTKSLIDNYAGDDEVLKKSLNGILSRDYDGFYTLEYCFVFYWMGHATHGKEIERVCQHIQNVLDTTTDNSIRNKYIYLSNRINIATENRASDNAGGEKHFHA